MTASVIMATRNISLCNILFLIGKHSHSSIMGSIIINIDQKTGIWFAQSPNAFKINDNELFDAIHSLLLEFDAHQYNSDSSEGIRTK